MMLSILLSYPSYGKAEARCAAGQVRLSTLEVEPLVTNSLHGRRETFPRFRYQLVSDVTAAVLAEWTDGPAAVSAPRLKRQMELLDLGSSGQVAIVGIDYSVEQVDISVRIMPCDVPRSPPPAVIARLVCGLAPPRSITNIAAASVDGQVLVRIERLDVAPRWIVLRVADLTWQELGEVPIRMEMSRFP